MSSVCFSKSELHPQEFLYITFDSMKVSSLTDFFSTNSLINSNDFSPISSKG